MFRPAALAPSEWLMKAVQRHSNFAWVCAQRRRDWEFADSPILLEEGWLRIKKNAAQPP